MKLGCIADDLTGATDIAAALTAHGLRVALEVGTNVTEAIAAGDADAVVVALKSRTIPVEEAVLQSLAAGAALRAAGAPQIYVKYCSTFDSTADGNIGPVTEALLRDSGAAVALSTPAYPEQGRTVYQGHLFVNGRLLSESSMREHPLTPMTDSDLVRLSTAQSEQPVGLVDLATVRSGATAVRARLDELAGMGRATVIGDAITDTDLKVLATAVATDPVVAGSAGLAGALAANAASGAVVGRVPAACRSARAAVIAGSVSAATNAQVRAFVAAGAAAFAVDPLRIASGADVVSEILEAVRSAGDRPILVYSTAGPEQVQRVQQELGVAVASQLVEGVLAAVASGLVAAGVRRLVVAGGEASGAVVQGLGLRRLRIGTTIDIGVPWCEATLADGDVLSIALKSGNFGAPDFFARALELAAMGEAR